MRKPRARRPGVAADHNCGMHPPTTLPSTAVPAALSPPDRGGAVRLDHWGLMRARGSDAATFLHSQLTSDVAALPPGAVRLAGFCSAKGRLQASFLVWQNAGDELLLACHASVLPTTLKRLSMFVLRAKCKLCDAAMPGPEPGSPPLHCTGLVGEVASAALRACGLAPDAAWQAIGVDGGSLLALPAVDGLARAVWVAPEGAPMPGPADAAPIALETWRRLEVRSGVPQIESATVDQFVPQMLNYELIGGVDFKKGCYPGQEIVARSQYRGTVKRRMFLFELDAPAAAGQEVFHAADPGQPAGMVVNAAGAPGGAASTALVELKLAALGGTLHLGAVDGPPLRPTALPYAVPLESVADA